VELLNEFSLPRAVVDFGRHSFVAWNSKFLEYTGFNGNEMKSSKPEDLLTFGDSPLPLFEPHEAQSVRYFTCIARRPFGADPARGYVVQSDSELGYVMLDLFEPSTAEFEQGRSAGRQEERERIARAFHEEVSSSMIAALFLIETAKSELDEAGSPQAEAVSKASDILTEVTEKIVRVIDEPDSNQR
jgi:signal transduction histidine kinase